MTDPRPTILTEEAYREFVSSQVDGRCPRCLRFRPLAFFVRRSRDGHRHFRVRACRVCDAARHWRANYGLSMDEYEDLLERQGGRCAVCGEPPDRLALLEVDHDHETGRVRGLICKPCNSLVFGGRDDPARLLDLAVRAASYLKGEAMQVEQTEVVDLERKRRLDELAEEIQEEIGEGRRSLLDAAERYFRIGGALAEARSLMQSDREFGGWIREQGWPWSRQWMHTLRLVGEHEDEIRAILVAQVNTAQREGLPLRPLNIKAALGEVLRTAPNPDQPLSKPGERFTATATVWLAPWREDEHRTVDDVEDFAEEWRVETAAWPDLSSASFAATPLLAEDPKGATGSEFPAVLAAIGGVLGNGSVGSVSSVTVNAPEVEPDGAEGLRIHVDGARSE